MNLSRIFETFPNFHKWSQQKKLDESHLDILTEFKDTNQIKALIQWIEQNHVSHSQGVQILELAGELILMGKPIKASLDNNKKAGLLIEDLKKIRQPQSSYQTTRQSQIVKNLKLSSAVKAKQIRDKDQSGLSVEFKSFSLKDFKNKIGVLKSLYEQLEKERFWKN